MDLRIIGSLLIVASVVAPGISPTVAAIMPAGVYQCTNADSAPAGLLKVAGNGDYQYEAVSDADFTPVAGDPSNGSGALSLDGNALTPQSGPLKSYFKATGQLSSDMGVTSLSFSDSAGNQVLDCSP